MNILIIGGTRFVGPILVEKLLGDGHSLTVFNRGTAKDTLPEPVVFIKGDRNNGFEIDTHFDAVIDMCAYTGEQTSRALKELSFDLFVHFGSIASYKKSEVFPLSEDSETGYWPLMGEYSKGKVECETILANSGIQYATIRPTYILGPKNYVDRERFIYSRLNNKQEIILPGNGQALTQFVFAKDVAEIIALIIKNKATGAFNCVGDEFITLKGLVGMMAKVVGTEPVITYNPAADGEKQNEEEFPFANDNCICTNQRTKDLGYVYISLYEGLQSDYKDYYESAI